MRAHLFAREVQLGDEVLELLLVQLPVQVARSRRRHSNEAI